MHQVHRGKKSTWASVEINCKMLIVFTKGCFVKLKSQNFNLVQLRDYQQ